jgi:hypothetical protein
VRVPDGGKRRGRSCDGWMVAARRSTSIAFGKVLIDSLHFFPRDFFRSAWGIELHGQVGHILHVMGVPLELWNTYTSDQIQYYINLVHFLSS